MRSQVDLIVRSRVFINRPSQDVWRHLLNMGTWMSGVTFRAIQGRRGEGGEVQVVQAAEGSPYKAYFATTVRATPYEQFVLKVRPVEGEDYFGFADFSLTEADGQTELVYDIYLELRFAADSEEHSRRFRDEQYHAVMQEVQANNLNLKKLVEEEQDVLQAPT